MEIRSSAGLPFLMSLSLFLPMQTRRDRVRGISNFIELL
jgi:hypothetical protein